ncbi:MAG TPA: methyltransferase domain-containing protein [Acidimicrobiia bacterium]
MVLHVDAGNTDQANAWNGIEGASWARDQDRYDRLIQPFHLALLDAAAVAADAAVLDVGCGCGQTTREAARAARRGSALGVDLSSQMLERARGRAEEEGLTNVSFVQADAQVQAFAADTFDVVISRFGAMFFADPPAAFANLARASHPGAGLAIVVWQPLSENEWLREIRDALAMDRDLPTPRAGVPGPFSLSDPDLVTTILAAAGYRDVELREVRESLVVGSDVDDAYGFASRMPPVLGLLNDLDDAARADALGRLRASIVAHERDGGISFGATAWLITATRA